MTRHEMEPWQLRTSRFEMVEERLALSADPIPALVLHGALVGAVQDELVAYDHHALDLQASSTLAPQLGSVHNTTGVNYVHSNYGFDGAGQTVAVIDSGIAWDHYNLGRGYGANYRVVGGWDFAENDANPYDDAPAGFHGTHVAGIIGSDHATNTGVAPGADLVALRVFNDSGQGSFAWVESALQWVITHHDDFENPITTINMSLGVPSMNGTSIPNWTSLEDELRTLNQMGIFIAVSAGNDFTQFNTQGLSYPAVSQYVVPVSSANDAGTAMSNFSQRDDRVLVAPGETITSTVPDALFSFNGTPNDWASASGTSMASPYVAGASVLLREAFWSIGVSNVNQDMIYDVLFDTADLIYDPITAASYHFIDVDAAIASIISSSTGGGSGGTGGGSQTPPPPPPPPPPPSDSDATGNTSQTATQVGTVNNGTTFYGQIANAADKDFYRFTAGATGRITLTSYPNIGLTTAWQSVPAGAQIQGQAVSFDVVAGQSYVVGLGQGSGTGNYGVQVALQAVPTDGDATGNTLQTATQVGTVNNGTTFYGQIANAVDKDFYRFTAGTSGRITLTSYPNNGLTTAWQSVPAGAQVQGQAVSFDVVAGQSYVVGLGQASGTGNYGVQVAIQQAATNLGTVDFRQVNDTNVAGERWYSVTAARAGYFTVIANSPGRQNIDVQIYSASKQLLGDGANSAGYGRADATVAAGQQLLVRVVGNSNDTDLTFVNLVSVSGNRVDVTGTAAGDNFSFVVGTTHQLTVKDISYSLASSTIRTVNINGAGGSDYIYFAGSTANESVDLGVGSSTFVGRNLQVNVAQTETQVYVGGGGTDTLRMYDSAGNDTLVTTQHYSELYGAGFYNVGHGFRNLTVTANAGGYDRATMNDSAGNDTFVAQQNSSQMRAATFTHIVQGFESVTAQATGGTDRATLTDSAGNDTLTARRGSMQLDGPGYQIIAKSFDNVTATAGGGYDSAVFFDVTAPNQWQYRAGQTALLRGSNFYNLANRFENVATYSTVTQTYGTPVAVGSDDNFAAANPIVEATAAKPASVGFTVAESSPVVQQDVSRAAYFESFERLQASPLVAQISTMRRGGIVEVQSQDLPVTVADETKGEATTDAKTSPPSESSDAPAATEASATVEQPAAETSPASEASAASQPQSLELAAVDLLFESLSESP